MADTKITALTDGATAELTDRFPAARDPTGTPVNRWVNVQYIITKILSLANTWLATQTVTPASNTSAIVSSGYSLTGANAQSQVDLAGTWNTSGAPTLLKSNVTDTASNSASLLVDLQVGGTSKFKVRKDGVTTIASAFICSLGSSIHQAAVGFHTRSSGSFGFTNESTGATGLDTLLYRDAAGSLAQRNSTNAQTFSLYNTYTDASNYERLSLSWSSNVCYLKNANAGTGSARLMVPVTGATTVAALPAASTAGAGARAFVTDANSTTFMSTVAAGGANAVPVVSDGTNWKIG